MLARHLPLIWVFAGGCLSGATLIVFLRSEPETLAPPKEQRKLEHTTEPSEPRAAAEAAVRDDALADEAAVVEPASPKGSDDDDAPTEAGSSVADVLMHLEAAYRQGLAAAAPANAPSSPDTAAPTAREEPAVAATVAVAAPVAAPATPPTSAPPAAAPPAPAPPADQAEVLAARDDAPRDVHVGDVNQNTTNIGTLHQGDLYLLQQLAYLQYFQPLPPSADARAASTERRATPGFSTQFSAATRNAQVFVSVNGGHEVTTRGAPTFSFPIINPDNPWGFDFPPPPLVK